MDDESVQIMDVRSREHFFGEEPEPRAGLQGGHIPSSICVPYPVMIENGLFKNKRQLKEIFKALNIDSKRLIFSCGSGVTACILALAATECGYRAWSIYDGSWSEWGRLGIYP